MVCQIRANSNMDEHFTLKFGDKFLTVTTVLSISKFLRHTSKLIILAVEIFIKQFLADIF